MTDQQKAIVIRGMECLAMANNGIGRGSGR